MIDFARTIGWPLDPWEEVAVIRGGELLENGTPRFRFLLIIVARQNGKTLLFRILVLWWMFVGRYKLTLAAHTSRDMAKQSWQEVITMAEQTDLLARELPRRYQAKQVGEEAFWNLHGAYFRFGAANRRLGRGSTVQRVGLDEIREHKTFDAYDAVINAGNAVADFQAVAITNMGDEEAVVLDALRDEARAFIETGQGNPRLGLLEWSAPPGSAVTDPAALAAANPNLGRRIDLDVLMGAAITASRQGGEMLARFKTEVLCMRVPVLDPAIEPEAWSACGYDPDSRPPLARVGVDLAEHRRQLALCLDVALDGSHATLIAAATFEGVTYVEVIRRWIGFGCTAAVRRDLPGIVGKLRPRAFGWFPDGPAAAIAAALRTKQPGRVWPPPRVEVAELSAVETTAVCMGLAEQVTAGQIRHPRDEMLNAHVEQGQRLTRGEARWLFARAGVKPIDGLYALAGAVHLARSLKPRSPLRGVSV